MRRNGFSLCSLWNLCALCVKVLVLFSPVYAQSWNISTIAGGALPVNLPGASASLYGPQTAMAVDPAGNLFFADGNTVLRLGAVSGVITLVAGNGTQGYTGDNGPAVAAQLHNPYGIALDSAGNLYISSSSDHVIRKVSNGTITTVVGTGVAGYGGDNGPAAAAQLNSPSGLAFDSLDNLYITDQGNNVVREVSGGVITTVAGNGTAGFSGDNGPATSAQLNAPRGVAIDASGNLYIADCGNSRIRLVSAGVIGTIAGNGVPGYGGDGGPATAAQLNAPTGVTLDAAGNIYIADYYNNRIRKVANGVINTVAGKGTQAFSGDNGPAVSAQLNRPFLIAVDISGNLYIADYGNNRIRQVAAGVITTVAGNGTSGFSGDTGSAVTAQLHFPWSVALDSSANLYVADLPNNRIRRISASGVINTVAGTGTAGFSGDAGSASAAQLNQPSSVAADASGNLYIADSANNRVRKISSSGIISTVAGNGTAGFAGDNGPATNAQLNQPLGVAVDSSGNLYIADAGNNRIRKVTGTTIATYAGNGNPGFGGDGGSPATAQLNNPMAVSLDTSGNLYIADSGNNRIRKITGSTISTVAGNGNPGYAGDGAAATAAQLNAPSGVAAGANGVVYVADTVNNVVRKIFGGNIVTIAGGGASLGDGGPSTNAELGAPQGLALDASGNVYIADTADNRIRQMVPVPLSIIGPTSLQSVIVGVIYPGVTFTAVGGAGGYTWSATGIPKGLSLSAGGLLSGTPTLVGTFPFPVTVKDSAGATATINVSLTVANPTPAISALNPSSITAAGAAFTLTVNGSGFIAGAVVRWNNAALTTKVVNATQLTASVTAPLIASATTVVVTVLSGGNTSIAANFTVDPLPVPAILSLSPASAVATGAAFTLTVNGTNFLPGSVVQWDGSRLVTTVVNATQVTAAVTAALIAAAGNPAITVVSPGGVSSPVTFSVNPLPPPAITSLNPSSATAYSAAFTLTVNGTGFLTGAVVQWNSTSLVTKVVSATQLTASVPASLINGAGTVPVAVVSGGNISGTANFTLTPQPPTLTTLSPASAIATGPALSMTVNGTNFAQNAIVQWNGSALSTSFISATQLSAYIPASLVAMAGTATVAVNSAGTTTSTVTFTINAPPAITSLSPASVIAGMPAFTLGVTGTGFAQGAVVQWNGSPLPTTFVTATQVSAAVPTGLITTVGTAAIQVSLAGVSSAGATLAINGPPAISGLSPASAAVGGAAFTLTVNGSGFISGATVQWNGTPLTTKFVSATQLTAAITASQFAAAGNVGITVSFAGVSSASITFPVNPPPAIATLSPATVSASGAAFTLTVNGTGFVSGATVQWNGTPLPTTYVSATQLTAAVPANTAAVAGTASITVASGSVSSPVVKLTLTAAQPTVTTGGVVPLYSSTPVIQPGSWISIYGTGLATSTATWTGNFPTTLAGTSVTIDGKAAYLWSVSPTQINLQAPNDTNTGTVPVVVTTATGNTSSTVTLAAYGPSFSLLPGSSYAAGVILTPAGTGAYASGKYDLEGPSGKFSFSTRPVRAGEILELYGVGFGPTTPAIPAGKAWSGAAATTNPVSVTIGGTAAQVLFAGMTSTGVYQLNIVVPAVSAGDQVLLASVGGTQTPAGVLLSLQ